MGHNFEPLPPDDPIFSMDVGLVFRNQPPPENEPNKVRFLVGGGTLEEYEAAWDSEEASDADVGATEAPADSDSE